MKIGIITDGRAELHALKRLFPKLQDAGAIVGAFHADLQPKGTPQQMVRNALDGVHTLRHRNADRIVLLIDREDLPKCPPELARQITAAFQDFGYADVCVAVKDRALENWLIADPGALRRLGKRFKVSPRFAKHVSPNKADHVSDALGLLRRAAVKQSYHKGRDPARILEKLDVSAAAKNSRSFRRFLRLMRDSRYRTQSKKP